jgi:hypothetical protein
VEDSLAPLVWLAVELLLLYTGKVVVSALSFGRWRGEKIDQKEGRIYSAAGSLSFIRDGQRVITVNGLLFAGIGFYLALVALLIFSVR